MKRMTAGEVISSVVFAGAGAFFLLAAMDAGRAGGERVVLAVCGIGTVIASFRFQIAALVQRGK